jgi:hypothetical protein
LGGTNFSLHSGSENMDATVATGQGNAPDALGTCIAARKWYKLQIRIWWTTYLTFLVGGSVAATFGSAFGFLKDADRVTWGWVALTGGVLATIGTALTPDKRSDWAQRAYDHVDSAILKFHAGRIGVDELLDAYDRAKELFAGAVTSAKEKRGDTKPPVVG